nr:hypothetical protein [Salmonella enterica]
MSRLHHAGGAGRIGRRAERAGIERVHGGDVAGAGQEHVDLGETAQVCTGLGQHPLDVDHDIGELRLEAVGQRAARIEAGNAGDEQEIADAGGKGRFRLFVVTVHF